MIFTKEQKLTIAEKDLKIKELTKEKRKLEEEHKELKQLDKSIKKGLDIKELEALSNLAVNVRKLAKFKHETKDLQTIKLFEIYSQLIDRLINDTDNFLTWAAKETIEDKKHS